MTKQYTYDLIQCKCGEFYTRSNTHCPKCNLKYQPSSKIKAELENKFRNPDSTVILGDDQ